MGIEVDVGCSDLSECSPMKNNSRSNTITNDGSSSRSISDIEKQQPEKRKEQQQQSSTPSGGGEDGRETAVTSTSTASTSMSSTAPPITLRKTVMIASPLPPSLSKRGRGGSGRGASNTMMMRGDGGDKDDIGHLELKSLKALHQGYKQQEAIVEGDEEVASTTSSISNTNSRSRADRRLFNSTWTIVVLILVLGFATSAAFLGLGMSTAYQTQEEQFERSAIDLTNKVQLAWEDYVNAASMIHNRCRGRDFSRKDFRQLYEYLTNSGLDFQAAQFDPNITREERFAAEEEAREFYAQYYPHIDYRGIVGFNYDNSTELEARNDADFYFPIHYMEPVIGNERAIDLDYHASGSRKRTVLWCMRNGTPALTDRLRLVQETETKAYGVVLMHPGVNLTTHDDVWPRDLASIVVRIRDLIIRAGQNQGEASAVYLFDQSDSSGHPLFLGGAEIQPNVVAGRKANIIWLDEVEEEDLIASTLQHSQYYRKQEVEVANKVWSVYVVALPGTFQPDLLFVILGGVIFILASILLAYWVHSNTRKIATFNKMRTQAEQEKAALILDNAKQAAKAERDLNDFIAHEVRNPVAAAMAACSFVKSEIHKEPPLCDDQSKQCARDDLTIIENALKFVNDLLRNMLDMHRASNKQIKVNMTPTDILHDVVEPVGGMLHQRDSQIKVQIHCPKNLVVMSDRLRLNQVILNLGRNSAKFVEKGFIRIRAEVIANEVVLLVEDSGPGIPKEKRERLFNKYQESLDVLSQGTGIGLFLCKNLVELMGGVIYLDDDYDSGVDGCPGTRFVVNLRTPPIELHDGLIDKYHDKEGGTVATAGSTGNITLESEAQKLPECLSVLFVDDDPILRKLFSRTVRTVAPGWTIREAANGETALKLAQEESFDLIFMDMYMASVEKQLLGTETVMALRSKGIRCRICGLSANDKETEFLKAGADVFTFKPFPCEARALTLELYRILYYEDTQSNDERLTPSEGSFDMKQ